jgi:hypothetical protein
VTQSEIPIPAETIRRAAQAHYERAESEAWRADFPWASLGDKQGWIDGTEAAIRAFLLEMQFEIERLPLRYGATTASYRLVSAWHPDQSSPSPPVPAEDTREAQPQVDEREWTLEISRGGSAGIAPTHTARSQAYTYVPVVPKSSLDAAHVEIDRERGLREEAQREAIRHKERAGDCEEALAEAEEALREIKAAIERPDTLAVEDAEIVRDILRAALSPREDSDGQ